MSGPATHLLLLRHGQVVPEWEGRIYGALDVPLSVAGREQSARVAASLSATPLAAVISSGLQRTEALARMLRSTRPLPRLDDPDLREIDRGQWAGCTPAEVESRWPGAWTGWQRAPHRSKAPGGESLTDLALRIRPRVASWTSQFPGRSIAIVTHAWVIRVFLCELLDLPLAQAHRFDVRTGEVVSILCHGSGCRGSLEGFGQDDHIRHPPS